MVRINHHIYKFNTFLDGPICNMGRTRKLKSPSFCLMSVVTPYEAALSNCLYLIEFLTDFSQILDSKSYDQAKQTL